MDNSAPPDAPFPGARSQVPGHRGESSTSLAGSTPARSGTLPLDAPPPERHANGWAVRLRCRAEEVHVRKAVVVYEEVVLRKGLTHEHVDIETRVKREELRVREDKYSDRRTTTDPLVRSRGE